MFTAQLKELISLPALSGGLIPASVNGQTNTGTIDMSKFKRAMFLLQMGNGATANAYLQQTANANGAGATNISGATLALISNEAGATEVRSDQLTLRYVKLNITTDAAGIISAMGFGCEPRFAPANAYDNASIASRTVANV